MNTRQDTRPKTAQSDPAWDLVREFVPRVNNQLSVPVGLLDLLLSDPNLSLPVRRQLEAVLASLEYVAAEISRLQRTARLTH